LTYGYWQRRFGGDKSVIGRTVTVDSRLNQIVGVMPASFRFYGFDPEMIQTLRFDRSRVFLGNFSYQGIARLKPGNTLAQANADVERMLAIWVKAWPPFPGAPRAAFENMRTRPALRPLQQDVVGNTAQMLWVLMGTVGIVLLIACANVANLLLVRAESRQQELAVRAALGAGRGQIARELMTESLVLGFLGGVAGVILAYGGLRLLVAVGPSNLPRLTEISIDWRVLGFAAAASLASGVLFGLAPIAKYARRAVALASGGRTASVSRERHRARNLLVVTQVALASTLLVGSVLMVRTFQTLRRVEPGFTRPDEIQTLRINIPPTQIQDPERVIRIQNAILEKISAVPGVTRAAFSSSVPMDGRHSWDALFAEDKTYDPKQKLDTRMYRFISPGFFHAEGTPLIAGRDLTWTDIYERRPVALVSENLARELWGAPAAALGKRIREPGPPNIPWREVIGVVGDVRNDGVQTKAPTIVYWPTFTPLFYGNPQGITRAIAFTIRSSRAGNENFLKDIRQALWSVNGNLPVFLVRTQQELLNGSLAATSFTLVMLAIAGAMALLLGVVGIYGVIAYVVSQRTREIGIRVALGAQTGEVKRMFVRYGLALAGVGIVCGLGAAAGLTGLMKSLLFGISPLDPMTYAAVPLILALAAVLASYLPARRAATVDPVEALRAE
jgi:predicted permease